MDHHQRLRDAVNAKDEGTEALRAGNVKRASYLYKSVYLYLGDLVSPNLVKDIPGASGSDPTGLGGLVQNRKAPKCSVEEQRAIDDVYAASINNLALTHLKLNRPAEAIHCATRVLSHDADNVKALFRRARGRIALGMLDEATLDLKRILELQPEDVDTLAALREVTHLEECGKVKEKAMFKKMFA